MPKRSNPFQRLIAVLHACLADGAKVEESVLLPTLDRESKREVDLVIEATQAGYPIVVSVEVVDRARPADRTWVEGMLKKHESLPTNRLVLVSRSGFTSTALADARKGGADTLTVEEAEALDWPLAVRLVGERIFQLAYIHWKCSLHLAGYSGWWSPKRGDLVYLPHLSHPTTVGIMAETILSWARVRSAILDHVRRTAETTYHFTYKQKGAQLELQDRSRADIIKLSVKVTVDHMETPVTFATKSFRGREFAVGQAVDDGTQLCFAICRDDSGAETGFIYNEKGFQRLQQSTDVESFG